MNRIYILILFIFISFGSYAQHNFYTPEDLYSEMPDSVRSEIITSLNTLFEGIANENIPTNLLDNRDIDFNTNYFKSLGWITRPDTTSNYPHPQILNIYRLTASDDYNITLAYSKSQKDSVPPVIYGIYTFIATKNNGKFVFSTPLKYRTRSWKSKVIDEITFDYSDKLNIERASNFVRKNRAMASKFGLPIINYKVYVTNNYQESLNLLGVDYEYGNNGIINRGYIVNPNTLFVVRGNEDFSHDALHMYAYYIRGKRNVTAEEGLAYTWGDAYYTDINGYIPNQNDLILELQQYLKDHPNETLLDIFNSNPRFFSYSERISPKSTISGVICDEIERIKGTEGIIELLNCGQGDDNYFISIEKLVGINRDNFDEKVMPLIMR
ncbi:hypothetical protein [Dysgonomonas sp. ZJ279]|uniref:hypothetical protein n=1 Tax=Dysgonomonas sp. ZJ279 TaxID=2709796 RepID=UPI0013ECE5D6|nr:hypothetical protein [Dysgonomonas sp. ZJ279]